LLVVNKQTYRVGSVCATTTSTVVDRGAPLYADQRRYLECPDCTYTSPFSSQDTVPLQCPLCEGTRIRALVVLQPEVAYPDGRGAVNELDDDQVYSVVTAAQMPTMQQPAD